SEKSELAMIRERDTLSQLHVDVTRIRKGAIQIQPPPHGLNPEMVLLVHHDGNVAPDVNRRTAAGRGSGIERRELLAHHVPFMQELTVRLLQLIHAHQDPIPCGWNHGQGIPDLRQHSQPLALSGTAREGIAFNVAGQTYACGQNDAGLLASAVHPAKPAAGQGLRIEAHSMARSWSRSDAASSNSSFRIARSSRSRSRSGDAGIGASSAPCAPLYSRPRCCPCPCTFRSNSRRLCSKAV